eukprot:11812480-Alexandrium_andersonii.AAC.1
MDLRRERGLTYGALRRRSLGLPAFEAWLRRTADAGLAQLLPAGPKAVGRLLAAYGQALFDRGSAYSHDPG